ncbi:hypothetical protein [Candidatus Vesicomyidisocius calyptogenae]|uniref:Uncharacterized protein n=1 Tax=Vesicomyosocius okutanii subsp. Calyptogena okutanii (strain HA) TaxID=412965 RepID=A5CW89_VESOH|nr:hypothetical protein [Candidatus Vesicomyosocius okutanii]BAF61779.1 conserved hypothetical protein [Candidatus Vesicomyosocius okutanii]
MIESKIISITLLLAVVIFTLFYLLTRNIQIPQNQSMPWQSFINSQGNTVVFNLTMGHSSLIDAMHLFGSEAEIAMFGSESKEPELEVFFSNTKVGGISVGVILNLIFDQKDTKYLNNNIKELRVMSSGVRKTTFNLMAKISMLDLKIKSLTLIPKVDLSKEIIINLFGEPSRVELVSQSVSYWYYLIKGVRIIIDDDNKEILEFYNEVVQ